MAVYTHHLPAWKKDEVAEIKKHAKEYTLIGLVDMYGIPAQQVQQIRRNLRGKAVIKVTRNTLIEHALAEIGGDAKGLTKFISGHSAMIFSNDNPFKLYKQLEKTKTKMAAKAGETAPEDIVVEKGPTSFKPGPIVGELQQAGIPAAIEGGKVKIRETKTIVKKGAVISAKIAGVLIKLDIKPMDVGLALQAAFHEGTIYEPSVLSVDETKSPRTAPASRPAGVQPVGEREHPDERDHGTDPDQSRQGCTRSCDRGGSLREGCCRCDYW